MRTLAAVTLAVILSGCAGHVVSAPNPVRPPRVSRSLVVTVVDQRPELTESEALVAALRAAFTRSGTPAGDLRITILDYRADFIQPSAGYAFGIVGAAFGATAPGWYGVTHVRAVLRDTEEKVLGRWDVKSEKVGPNTWGHGSARDVLNASFQEAVTRLGDQLATLDDS